MFCVKFLVLLALLHLGSSFPEPQPEPEPNSIQIDVGQEVNAGCALLHLGSSFPEPQPEPEPNSIQIDVGQEVNAGCESAKKKKIVCPEPFWPVMNECFFVFGKKMVKWHEARKQCQAMGGDLAAPQRPVALTMHLINKGVNTNLWLGGYKPHNGTYAWLSERNLSEEDFTSGQPDQVANGQAQEACVHYWPDGNLPCVGDYYCNTNWGFICQYLF